MIDFNDWYQISMMSCHAIYDDNDDDDDDDVIIIK